MVCASFSERTTARLCPIHLSTFPAKQNLFLRSANPIQLLLSELVSGAPTAFLSGVAVGLKCKHIPRIASGRHNSMRSRTERGLSCERAPINVAERDTRKFRSFGANEALERLNTEKRWLMLSKSPMHARHLAAVSENNLQMTCIGS